MSELILKNLSSSNQLSLKTFTAGSEIVPILGLKESLAQRELPHMTLR